MHCKSYLYNLCKLHLSLLKFDYRGMDPEFEKEEGSKNMIDETETETKKDRTFLDLLNLMEEFHPMVLKRS